MAHREFLAADGSRWDVWEVNPSRVERELEQVRRSEAGGDPSAVPPRRHSTMVASALSSGWLCFESGDIKRRLAPIPPDWEQLGDAELASLCERAAVAVRLPRRTPPSGEHVARTPH